MQGSRLRISGVIKTGRSKISFAGLCLIFLSSLAMGQMGGPALDIRVTPSRDGYAPGDTVLIALDIGITGGYHLYGNPLGPGIGKPLTIAMRDGGGVEWLDIKKTVPKKFTPEIGGWVYAYDKEAVLFLRGVARDAGMVKGTVVVDGLQCLTACHPVHYELPVSVTIDPVSASAVSAPHFVTDQRLTRFLAGRTEAMSFAKEPAALSVPVGLPLSLGDFGRSAAPMPAWDYSPVETASHFNIWMAIFFAFLAGILLNAMPCVLPVLGVKILSFASLAGSERRDAVIRSLVFSLGVIAVFLLLAALASFANYSWGKQFQDPKALVAIIAIIVVFSLGMFDVFMITVPGALTNVNHRKQAGIWGDFLKGIFATILATPCSGPFLGAVLAWAVTQPASVVFIIYGSIGAGMSLPYVLLSSSRRAARLLPKPGPWMNDFKGFMGFLLLAFAVYLLFGLPDDMVEPAILFCLIAALSAVVYGRFAPFGVSLRRKLVVLATALAIAAGGLYVSFLVVYPLFSSERADSARQGSSVWQPFSTDSLLAAHAAGRPVIVDFTANWCMNCQYNTIMVLSKKDVVDAIVKKGALALVADMTSPDAVQDSLLRKLGSQSIPFLALFPGDNPRHPVVMRDILTRRGVLKALKGLQ